MKWVLLKKRTGSRKAMRGKERAMRHLKPRKLTSSGILFLILAAFAAVSQSGCSNVPPIRIALTGTQDMTVGGSAVLVCIYQLKKNASFIRVPPDSFWQEKGKSFQSDISAPPMEIMLAPGDYRTFLVQPNPQTVYIGAAADFRNPNLKNWRQIYPVPYRTVRGLRITVDKDGLRIEPAR
jgi:type VI secretion system VasD/TssJ family lipoprotein